ncbi:Pentatricopeptide repeat-containing protein [Seminavis robusta]|uniref:Pentatricopeptide repeat-containing protein n=1 Tax=Seminavis robusta TaxID=568900 RepID=A0A9N8EVE6_9STRA|nr:Pentatricopeptide repeat-containing protein [Seminavis robusta]|eukprot:Sro2115_g315140.1 Pentatricopeptide repeat-containing protein (685) ;mRNA; r:2484-4538
MWRARGFSKKLANGPGIRQPSNRKRQRIPSIGDGSPPRSNGALVSSHPCLPDLYNHTSRRHCYYYSASSSSSNSSTTLRRIREQEGLSIPQDTIPATPASNKQYNNITHPNNKKRLQEHSRRNNRDFRHTQELLKAAQQRLQELKTVPSWNPQDWRDAQQVMEFWLATSNKGQQQQQQQKFHLSLEEHANTVQNALELLERMIQEQMAITQQSTSQQQQEHQQDNPCGSLAKVILTRTKWLDKITRHWQQLEKRTAQQQQQQQLPPQNTFHEDFLQKLEALVDDPSNSNGILHMNPRIYAMVMDVAARQTVRMASSSTKHSQEYHAGGYMAVLPTPELIAKVDYLESILWKQMPQRNILPDTVNYATVLQTWEYIGEGTRAQNCLQKICNLYENSQNSNDDNNNKMAHTPPNRECFQHVLNAFARGPKSPQTVDQCRQVMAQMQDYHSTRGLDTAPTVRTYNTLLTCLLHNPFVEEPIAQAERLFRQEMPVELRDKQTYNILLEMYSKRGMADEASALLQKMYELYQETQEERVAPYTKSFNLVLSALNKARNYAGVEEQFQLMEQLHADGALPNNVAPDQFTYSILLESWAQQVGKVPNATERCDNILYTMKRLSSNAGNTVRPTTVTYSIVMKAHAKVGNARRVEELLGEMMDEYMQRKNPDVRPICWLQHGSVGAFEIRTA